jgi:hypothetical protein
MQHFYDDDPMFQAGVQGFVDWYDTEGKALVGERANGDTTDAYTVGDLTPEAVGYLPIDDEILVDPDNDTYEPRDLSKAKGIVSLAEMDCVWTVAEALLVRPDQHVVFSGDFEGYEREYLTSRKAFEDAAGSLEFAAIKDPLDPFADEFDSAAVESSLLRTLNQVDPTKVLIANMDPYPMYLDLRHGLYEVNGEEVGVLAIITYNVGAAWGGAGVNALLQGFSIEINIERQAKKTLRMLAVWSEPKGGGIEPDDPIALNFAVNKSLDASERLSDICAGEITLDD